MHTIYVSRKVHIHSQTQRPFMGPLSPPLCVHDPFALCTRTRPQRHPSLSYLPVSLLCITEATSIEGCGGAGLPRSVVAHHRYTKLKAES